MKVKKRAALQQSDEKSAARWRMSTGSLILLGLAMLFAFLTGRYGPALFSHANALPRENPAASQSSSRWGLLEVTPIVLERPEEFFASDPPPPKIGWYFSGYSPERLVELFQGCGLADEQLSHLLDTNHWKVTPQGIWLEPSLGVVRELPPQARERIYRMLAEHPANVPQRYPFVYRKGGFDEWFARCDLPENKIELIRKMTFTRRDKLCFSDSQYFQLTLPSNEVRCLARTLSRVPTLLMTLRVTPDANIEALLEYWGGGARNRSLKPFLKSLARVPGGGSINVTHFFPPVPRLLAYSYPNPTNMAAPKPPDCFWTAMNFANDHQDHRFLDSGYTKSIIATEYQRIAKADTFGDVIMLYEPGSDPKAVHMCVYVAADVVFTKNGADLFQPWVLMHLPDMLVNYPSEKILETAVYRRIKR